MYRSARYQEFGKVLCEIGELLRVLDGHGVDLCYFIGVLIVTIFPIHLDVQILGFLRQFWHGGCGICATMVEDLPQRYRPSNVLRSTLKTRQMPRRDVGRVINRPMGHFVDINRCVSLLSQLGTAVKVD